MHKEKAAITLVAIVVAAYLLYKYSQSENNMKYTFPNGYADLDNWKNAEDGTDSFENKLTRMMISIARQEGYGVTGALPTSHNNPGDLFRFGVLRFFPNRDEGWQALEHQVRLYATGTSSEVARDATIFELAEKYTTTQVQEWAANVAEFMGVSQDTTLQEYFG